MNTILLIFFAIPLAVIIFSIALQKILRNPFLVAGIIFSILLIIAIAFFEPIFLIAVIAYTILAFITAVITRFVKRCLRRICRCNSNSDSDDDDDDSDSDDSNSNNCGTTTTTAGTDAISVLRSDDYYTCRWNRGRRY